MAVSVSLKQWTLQELHSLPDDGNKYEVVHGELFVTPPPSNVHQTIIANLLTALVEYVDRERLGHVHTARSVIRRDKSEVEPDLFVRAPAPAVGNDWENAPTPILVVEVLSPFSRRRDLDSKRRFYLSDVGAPEYWIVDPDTRTVRIARSGREDTIVARELTWHPDSATSPLRLDVAALFV